MGKILEQVISRFDKGIINDPRVSDIRYCQFMKNFDAFTFPHKLIPFRSSESAHAAPDGNGAQFVNFTTAIVNSTLRLYALGVVTAGGARASISYKTDFTGTAWTSPAGNESSAGSRNEDFFIYYKNYIYGARAGTNLWRHGDITGTPSWTDSWQTLTHTNMAQGLIHSQDDILYIPYDNKIATWDNTAFSATALTLPDNLVITSLAEYGNYLAIACRPLGQVGNSKVFLWNKTSTDVSEVIDWGEGNLQVLENLEGHLIGISLSSLFVFNTKIIFRQYAGGTTQIFAQLDSTTPYVAGDLPLEKQKVNNYLYFLLTITLNGVKEQGLWKVGRSKGESFSVVMDRTPNNDTALTSGTLEGFAIVGEYILIAYISNSDYAISKTDDTNLHAHTAVYETVILNGGDSSKTKKLIGITIINEALTANSDITVKYKKDEETSFTTILNYDGTSSSSANLNKLNRSAVNIESSGVNLPTYKEITFRVEITAESAGTLGNISGLLGLKYKSELIEDDIY